MNLINPGGLLWFDDDNRRPIQQKIAEAAQRFRERVGYEPTVCQLNPAQATALEASAAQSAARSKRAAANAVPALPESLKVVPSALIQPHCYLLGIAEGEQPRAAMLPFRDDEEAESPSGVRQAQSSKRAVEVGAAAVPQRVAAATRRAARRARKVHAVQATLIVEAEEPQTATTKRRQGNNASPSPSPSADSRSHAVMTRTAVGATRLRTAAKTPKAKAPAAATPVSLLAAAPVKPAARSPRATERKKPVTTKPIKTRGVSVPAASKAPVSAPAVNTQALKPKLSAKLSATSGKKVQRISAGDATSRAGKRSA